MESFPDPSSLTDDELRALITELAAQKSESDYMRRVALGKIEVIRTELRSRGENAGGSDPSGVREPRRPGPYPGAGAISIPLPEGAAGPGEPPPSLLL